MWYGFQPLKANKVKHREGKIKESNGEAIAPKLLGTRRTWDEDRLARPTDQSHYGQTEQTLVTVGETYKELSQTVGKTYTFVTFGKTEQYLKPDPGSDRHKHPDELNTKLNIKFVQFQLLRLKVVNMIHLKDFCNITKLLFV